MQVQCTGSSLSLATLTATTNSRLCRTCGFSGRMEGNSMFRNRATEHRVCSPRSLSVIQSVSQSVNQSLDRRYTTIRSPVMRTDGYSAFDTTHHNARKGCGMWAGHRFQVVHAHPITCLPSSHCFSNHRAFAFSCGNSWGQGDFRT